MPIEVVNLLTHCRIRLLTISLLKMGEKGKESGIDIHVIDIRNVWSSLRSWIDRAMYDQPFLLEKFIYVKLFVLEEQRTVWTGKSAAVARYRAYNLANQGKNLSFIFSFHSILCNLDIWKLLFLRFFIASCIRIYIFLKYNSCAVVLLIDGLDMYMQYYMDFYIFYYEQITIYFEGRGEDTIREIQGFLLFLVKKNFFDHQLL